MSIVCLFCNLCPLSLRFDLHLSQVYSPLSLPYGKVPLGWLDWGPPARLTVSSSGQEIVCANDPGWTTVCKRNLYFEPRGVLTWGVGWSWRNFFSHHKLFVSLNPVCPVCLHQCHISSTTSLSKTDTLLEDLLLSAWSSADWSSSTWAKACGNPHQWPIPCLIYSHILILLLAKPTQFWLMKTRTGNEASIVIIWCSFACFEVFYTNMNVDSAY